jgi:hypothetical protein
MQIKTKIVSCHTANSKPVKQEVNGTVYSSLKYSLVGVPKVVPLRYAGAYMSGAPYGTPLLGQAPNLGLKS